MAKKFLPLLIISVIFIISCNNFGKESASGSDTTIVTVAGFLGQADTLVDKAVIIEGTVLHTCKHGGKRMFLVDNNNDSVTVEIIAGESVAKFDEALVGSKIRVTGHLREERIDEKYLNEWEAEVMKPGENHETGLHTGAKGHEDNTAQEKLEQINLLRADLASSGKDHLSNFSIEAISYRELK